jgi:hypothetical protein
VDQKGLYASQQLFGIWPKTNQLSLEAICAILNGPIANAFVKEHSPSTGARSLVSKVQLIPTPPNLSVTLTEKVRAYEAAVATSAGGLFASQQHLSRMLAEIDAMVLRAYDLPPRLEKVLLEKFRGSTRPVAHKWEHWFPDDFESFLPLHRYLSDEFQVATSGWVTRVFMPLPQAEAEAVREFLE